MKYSGSTAYVFAAYLSNIPASVLEEARLADAMPGELAPREIALEKSAMPVLTLGKLEKTTDSPFLTIYELRLDGKCTPGATIYVNDYTCPTFVRPNGQWFLDYPVCPTRSGDILAIVQQEPGKAKSDPLYVTVADGIFYSALS